MDSSREERGKKGKFKFRGSGAPPRKHATRVRALVHGGVPRMCVCVRLRVCVVHRGCRRPPSRSERLLLSNAENTIVVHVVRR